eukprot:TRINITY_DN22761_c0_g1_i3.p1 TRINITY_DN22761_c0_g1~~TRINITY_DN22761_c0_g1_i3.p1  ORF type:complete len:592 (+),score=183.77 TRINITY_DN22761_c0_g1_i3:86-1777(+)
MRVRAAVLAAAAAAAAALPAGVELGGAVPMSRLLAEVGNDSACAAKLRAELRQARRLQERDLDSFGLRSECGEECPVPAAAAAASAAGVIYFLMLHDSGGAGRLLGRLRAPGARFVLNMDADAPEEHHARVRELVDGRGDAAILSPAVDVDWGSDSMVEAELRAAQLALRIWGAEQWSHLAVLSGADYPLLPAEGLLDFFARRAGGSFYYRNGDQLPADTWELMLTELVAACGRQVYHLAWRDEAVTRGSPEGFQFEVGNTWKFWDRGFVEWFAGEPPLFQRLRAFTRLTLSADELFWPTLHRHSPHCRRLAPVSPRDYYSFLWPGDDAGRDCGARVRLAPVEWYCAKRPFVWTERDTPRASPLPSALLRKVDPVASAALLDALDGWADGTAPRPAERNASRPHRVRAADGSCLQFSLHAAPPEAVREGVEQLLQWGFGDCASAGAFLLTDCVGGLPAAKGGGCLVSAQHPEWGGAPGRCRLRPAAAPALCFSARGDAVRAGEPLGFAPCKDYREAQVYYFSQGCEMRSAARVADEHPYSQSGLCVTHVAPAPLGWWRTRWRW